MPMELTTRNRTNIYRSNNNNNKKATKLALVLELIDLVVELGL